VKPPEDAYTWTTAPEQAPDRPETVEIEFDQGIPVALDGEKLDGVALIARLNQIGARNGVGRIDHIENRLVGIKSREVYEAPAAIILHAAHQELENMTLSKDQIRFKTKVAAELSDLIYNGLWFSALHQDLAAFVASTQRYVTGAVRVELYKGFHRIVSRRAQHSLYDPQLATYSKDDTFDHQAAAGFIGIFGLQLRTQSQIQWLGRSPDEILRLSAGGTAATG
jgi:argininosuccinate synthase